MNFLEIFDPFTARFVLGLCILTVVVLFAAFAMWRP